VLLAGC